MTDHCDVFLSYSHNDRDAAANLHNQLNKLGLSVFWDKDSIRAGDLWLNRLQDAVGGCGAFVVLVGRDGVGRWIGAETQVALNRYFGPHDDAERLPIFPILLNATGPDSLPAFLSLFQATPWDGVDALPERLLDDIRARNIVADRATRFEGCPFVGLSAYRTDQAHLFFGRQKETLDALACFDTRLGSPTVRWLEINGNSGSGKSSLMNAGILPLIDQGWLWPRTGFAQWQRIGPMIPGEHPLEMLAECLARAFNAKMGAIIKNMTEGDDDLRYWLRDRKRDDTAFLLAIDQFEELFTFADADERCRFDRLLADALEDADCPLFVISTVRSDFLDRFAEDLPRLVAVRNRVGKSWTLAPIGEDGLREVIDGPARLAGLDVSEIREAMVAEARDEPGALPLVENALHWLWQRRNDNVLSGRLFTEQGGLAGLLSRNADDLLSGLEPRRRDRALELLFRMVQVDPEGRRHTRRRIALSEAMDIAGADGRDLIDRLAGRRARGEDKTEGPLRLITVTEEADDSTGIGNNHRWVNLIHETLIRSKGLDAAGKPQPYWPTLWHYIEKNKERAARRDRLKLMAREWKERRGLSRLFGLAGWSSLFGFRGLASPNSLEQRYLRWSRGRAGFEVILLAAVLGAVGHSVYWVKANRQPYQALEAYWLYNLGITNPPFPKLVSLATGTFLMGSPKTELGRDDNEGPRHEVKVQPFSIGATEVTFRQYGTFCDATGRALPSDAGWGKGNLPVIYVDWSDARAYAKWLNAMTGLGCRLPSEAEWEYAARAGTKTRYAFGDDITAEAANIDYKIGKTTEVGSYRANVWGLYDMHGNVWEWVEDCWHDSYDGAPDDGQAWLEDDGGDCSRRVLRGGSWRGSQDFARSAFRDWVSPSSRDDVIGFRVVCSSPSSGSDP